jgi:hypothetical protein
MLDPALHAAVTALLPAEKKVLARRFLELRAPSEWKSILSDFRRFHRDRVAKISAGSVPVPLQDDGLLILHVLPLSAVGATSPIPSENLFRTPDRFPPLGRSRPQHARVDQSGLLTGAHTDGLDKPQGAYVHVSRAGVVEAVAASLGVGSAKNIELRRISEYLVTHVRIYAAGLNASGVAPPYAVFVSLAGVKNMRLVETLLPNAFPEDLPAVRLRDDVVEFDDVILELVPGDADGNAEALRPLLNHLAHAGGLAMSPYFDADGTYSLKRASAQ